YLMIGEHFGATSVVAEIESELAGAVLALPSLRRRDTLFIWQVVVAERARGLGLATRLLRECASRARDLRLKFIEATVTPSNLPSQRLFRSFGERYGASLEVSVGFTEDDFGDEKHEAEELYRIGILEATKGLS
ncbi:MAG: GNAT family N-acetyltransferase, partial [Planctomycetes bacterium]|nr:GNAT family N-acetyltransferase [Planctomycetota bacterium]